MIDVQSPSETASAAAGPAEPAPASAPDGQQSWQCPECDYRGPSEVGLKIHFRKVHKGVVEPQWTERPRKLEAPPHAAAEPLEGSPATRTAAEYEGIRRKAVDAFKTVGGLSFLIGLQVTAFTIDNRAERFSWQAIVYAQRNERFCRLLEAFISVMEAGELAKLGSDLGMALGVDIGMLHPARPVRFGPVNVPGFVFLDPIKRELSQVAQLRAEAAQVQAAFEQQMAAARAAENGIRPQDAAAGQ